MISSRAGGDSHTVCMFYKGECEMSISQLLAGHLVWGAVEHLEFSLCTVT